MFKNTLRLARPLAGQTTTTTCLLIRNHALKPLSCPFSSESLSSSHYLTNLQNAQDALSHKVLELNKKLAYLDGRASVNLPNSNNLPPSTPHNNPDLSALAHEIAKLTTKLQEQASVNLPNSNNPPCAPHTNPDLSDLAHEIAKLNTKLQEQASAHSASSKKINNAFEEIFALLFVGGFISVLVVIIWVWLLKDDRVSEVEDVVKKAKMELRYATSTLRDANSELRDATSELRDATSQRRSEIKRFNLEVFTAIQGLSDSA